MSGETRAHLAEGGHVCHHVECLGKVEQQVKVPVSVKSANVLSESDQSITRGCTTNSEEVDLHAEKGNGVGPGSNSGVGPHRSLSGKGSSLWHRRTCFISLATWGCNHSQIRSCVQWNQTSSVTSTTSVSDPKAKHAAYTLQRPTSRFTKFSPSFDGTRLFIKKHKEVTHRTKQVTHRTTMRLLQTQLHAASSCTHQSVPVLDRKLSLTISKQGARVRLNWNSVQEKVRIDLQDAYNY